jgi:hypothetical protein
VQELELPQSETLLRLLEPNQLLVQELPLVQKLPQIPVLHLVREQLSARQQQILARQQEALHRLVLLVAALLPAQEVVVPELQPRLALMSQLLLRQHHLQYQTQPRKSLTKKTPKSKLQLLTAFQ